MSFANQISGIDDNRVFSDGTFTIKNLKSTTIECDNSLNAIELKGEGLEGDGNAKLTNILEVETGQLRSLDNQVVADLSTGVLDLKAPQTICGGDPFSGDFTVGQDLIVGGNGDFGGNLNVESDVELSEGSLIINDGFVKQPPLGINPNVLEAGNQYHSAGFQGNFVETQGATGVPMNTIFGPLFPEQDPFQILISFRVGTGADISSIRMSFVDGDQNAMTFSGRNQRVGATVQNVQGTGGFVDLTVGQNDLAIGSLVSLVLQGNTEQGKEGHFKMETWQESVTDNEASIITVARGTNSAPFLFGIQFEGFDGGGNPVAGADFEDGSLVIRGRVQSWT